MLIYFGSITTLATSFSWVISLLWVCLGLAKKVSQFVNSHFLINKSLVSWNFVQVSFSMPIFCFVHWICSKSFFNTIHNIIFICRNICHSIMAAPVMLPMSNNSNNLVIALTGRGRRHCKVPHHDRVLSSISWSPGMVCCPLVMSQVGRCSPALQALTSSPSTFPLPSSIVLQTLVAFTVAFFNKVGQNISKSGPGFLWNGNGSAKICPNLKIQMKNIKLLNNKNLWVHLKV